MDPPFLVDIDGCRHYPSVAIDGCHVDENPAAPWERAPTGPGAQRCAVRMAWADAPVHYPAVLDPEWSRTGSMPGQRARHTATRLPNGRVLVAGGENWNGPTAGAALFDPATGTWTSTGGMSRARSRHTAITVAVAAPFPQLVRTAVLVLGGGAYRKGGEVYNISTGTWSAVPDMVVGRQAHTATPLPGGAVLVAGGEDENGNAMRSCEIYDPYSAVWSPAQDMGDARSRHTATAVKVGSTTRVLVAGGEGPGYGHPSVGSSELYDPVARSWSPSGPLGTARTEHAAAALLDGRVLVAGGESQTWFYSSYVASAEVFNPATGLWSAAGSLSLARNDLILERLPNGAVIAAGGTARSAPFYGYYFSALDVDLFDPSAGRWSTTTSLSIGRSGGAAAALTDGTILLTGGYETLAYSYLSSADRFRLSAIGESCRTDLECTNSVCADRVCCNVRCGGACDRCDLPGMGGTCSLISTGWPGDPSCSPYVCDGLSAACPTTCADDAGCLYPYNDYCDDSHHCVPRGAPGAACEGDRQCLDGHCVAAVGGGSSVCCRVACVGGCQACRADGECQVTCTLPPDPGAGGAPPLDGTAPTSLADATRFLVEGSGAVQTGVTATFDSRRVAVVRGRALAADGSPIPGVRVSVAGHAEYGSTQTRADGMFDLVVEGGADVVLDYALAGFVPIHRRVEVRWQDWSWAPDVVLTPYAAASPAIVLPSSEAQSIRGARFEDGDGRRQPLVIIPAFATATMRMADGTTSAIDRLSLRITELTVGARGPSAMPADLPPASAYTWAADFTVDEPLAANASSVLFDRPVAVYLQNFLGFPIGTAVPAGYYDRALASWVPAASGRVVRFESVVAGRARLDADSEAALSLDDSERIQLAAAYQPGTILWRVAVDHFTTWDFNWNARPAVAYDGDGFPIDVVGVQQDDDDDCLDELTAESIVECENQILGEDLTLAGSPLALHYRSDRVRGRVAARHLDIRLTPADRAPTGVKRVEVEVLVAGQRYARSHLPAPNLVERFTWDGRDAFGRTVLGSAPVRVNVGYVYDAVYDPTARFGQPGDGPPLVASTRGATEITFWRRHDGFLGSWDARAVGLGGWTIDPHHAYDPVRGVVHYGWGKRRSAAAFRPMIDTVGGGGQRTPADGVPARELFLGVVRGVAAAADGSVFVVDGSNQQLLRLGGDGLVRLVAGTGSIGYSGDGGDARQATLNFPEGVAMAPDGSVVVADTGNHAVRRIAAGIIRTMAGDGSSGSSGDGGLATQARLASPSGVAVASDGAIFIADRDASCVRRIDTDGRIHTAAGRCGQPGFAGDGGPSRLALLWNPHGLAVARDGSLYIADTGNARIRRVTTDGTIVTVAGTGRAGDGADGVPATQADLYQPWGLAVARDGTVLIADPGQRRVRSIGTDGNLATIAGSGASGRGGDGGPAVAATLTSPGWVGIAPDGRILVSDAWHHLVRAISAPLPGFAATELVLPSEDADELYIFSGSGRHLRTVDARLGSLRWSFEYDSVGRLAGLVDHTAAAAGLRTVIRRDASGSPTRIDTPLGPQTGLRVVGGYLEEVTDPEGNSALFHYWGGGRDGLLRERHSPRGTVHNYDYDPLGRLMTDGATLSLVRSDLPAGHETTTTTAAGRTVTHRTEALPGGAVRRTSYSPTAQSVTVRSPDGTSTTTRPDGTVVTVKPGADPRFGQLASFVGEVTVRTPGNQLTARAGRSFTATDPRDPATLLTETRTFTYIDDTGRPLTFASRFDRASRSVVETTPTGRTRTTTFDALGRATGILRPGLADLTVSYDSFGRAERVQQGTASWIATYNPATPGIEGAGALATITDPLLAVWQFPRDRNGRRRGDIPPSHGASVVAFDANSNPVSVTPPGRPEHRFLNFTPTDLYQTYQPPAVPGGGSTEVRYDPDGFLRTLTRPGLAALQMEYGVEGRLWGMSIPPRGLGTIDYEPGTDRIRTLRTPEQIQIATGYDGFLLTDLVWRDGGLRLLGAYHREHDALFRVRGDRVDGGVGAGPEVTYHYDDDGLLDRAGDLQIFHDYNGANGLLAGTSLGGFTDSYDWNPQGVITGYTARLGGRVLYSVSILPDARGRVSSRTETIDDGSGPSTHSASFTYHPIGFLHHVRRNGALVAEHVYDPNGNRLSRVPGGPPIATYDAQDRLNDVRDIHYSWRPSGGLEHRTGGGEPTLDLGYDAAGNLLWANVGGTRVDYEIDPLHHRVGRIVNGTLERRYVWDGERLVGELDGTGRLVSRFVYGSQLHVPDYFLRFDNGAAPIIHRIITDSVGSVRLVVAADGIVAQAIEYDELGRVLRDTRPGFQPFGFAGGLYDPLTRFVRFGVRDYDAETGRFTTPDPSLFGGGDSNVYTYAGNDPVNYVDVDGRTRRLASQIKHQLYDWLGDLVPGEAGIHFQFLNAALYAQEGDCDKAVTTAHGAILNTLAAGLPFAGLPSQLHHFATNKSLKTYTPEFERLANKYGLSLDDWWNKEYLPHRGRHPNAYHEFVWLGLERADREARGDAELFLALFDYYVKDPVRHNPGLLRKDFWR